MIARIDDDLHARLKARAAAEGRSLNALMTEVLAAAVSTGPTATVRARLARQGRLVVPPRSGPPPNREAALQSTRGAGHAASDALAAERAQG